MKETFIDIPGYEGLYQVSSLGRVKSLPKGDGNGNRERILKPETVHSNHTNYLRVSLCKDGKVQRCQVHRLVAIVFLPNTDAKPCVNHIDNNGENNSAENLEWCTAVENMQHSSAQGRQDLSRYLGGKAAGQLLKEKAAIRHQAEIGKVYGALTVVSYIVDTSLVRPKFKLVCTCSCGNTTNKPMYKVVRGTETCAECSFKSKMKI